MVQISQILSWLFKHRSLLYHPDISLHLNSLCRVKSCWNFLLKMNKYDVNEIEIRALAVWGRARYLSVTEALHNTDFHTWMGKKHFCFFQTAGTGNRTPNSGVKGSGANPYPRAPALNTTWFQASLLAPAVTVGERRELWILPPFFFASSFAYNFVRK